MKIENKLLNKNEEEWLNALLIVDFKDKEKLINQVNNAEIERQYTDFYLLIKFNVHKSMEPVSIDIRVPIEMRVYRTDSSPVQFLLHILDGYISEVEIFSADSTKINDDIRLEKIEVILVDELRKS